MDLRNITRFVSGAVIAVTLTTTVQATPTVVTSTSIAGGQISMDRRDSGWDPV